MRIRISKRSGFWFWTRLKVQVRVKIQVRRKAWAYQPVVLSCALHLSSNATCVPGVRVRV